GIAMGTDVADRLVERVILRPLRLQNLAVEGDFLLLRIDLLAQFGHFAVDGHAAGSDVLFAMPPRTEAGGRQIALQPHRTGLGRGRGLGGGAAGGLAFGGHDDEVAGRRRRITRRFSLSGSRVAQFARTRSCGALNRTGTLARSAARRVPATSSGGGVASRSRRSIGADSALVGPSTRQCFVILADQSIVLRQVLFGEGTSHLFADFGRKMSPGRGRQTESPLALGIGFLSARGSLLGLLRSGARVVLAILLRGGVLLLLLLLLRLRLRVLIPL